MKKGENVCGAAGVTLAVKDNMARDGVAQGAMQPCWPAGAENGYLGAGAIFPSPTFKT